MKLSQSIPASFRYNGAKSAFTVADYEPVARVRLRRTNGSVGTRPAATGVFFGFWWIISGRPAQGRLTKGPRDTQEAGAKTIVKSTPWPTTVSATVVRTASEPVWSWHFSGVVLWQRANDYLRVLFSGSGG